MHSRIKRDNVDVNNLLSTLTAIFINPFSPKPLLPISSGILVTDNITQDLMVAQSRGKEFMNKIIEERLWHHSTKSFSDPIKKLKLSIFSTMKKTKRYVINNKFFHCKPAKTFFSKIAIIAQKRVCKFTVFQYPLVPLALKKTVKSILMHKLEEMSECIFSVEGKNALTIDGMANVKQLKVIGMTYGSFAANLLTTILLVGKDTERIDVVFDVYRLQYIKSTEKNRTACGNLPFQQILPTAEIKQWNLFLYNQMRIKMF